MAVKRKQATKSMQRVAAVEPTLHNDDLNRVSTKAPLKYRPSNPYVVPILAFWLVVLLNACKFAWMHFESGCVFEDSDVCVGLAIFRTWGTVDTEKTAAPAIEVEPNRTIAGAGTPLSLAGYYQQATVLEMQAVESAKADLQARQTAAAEPITHNVVSSQEAESCLTTVAAVTPASMAELKQDRAASVESAPASMAEYYQQATAFETQAVESARAELRARQIVVPGLIIVEELKPDRATSAESAPASMAEYFQQATAVEIQAVESAKVDLRARQTVGPGLIAQITAMVEHYVQRQQRRWKLLDLRKRT